MSSFQYQCGCDPDRVGQAFEHGVLVCPEHRVPVAVYDREAAPWRGKATIELGLETRDHEEASLFVNDRVHEIFADDRVTSIVVSVQAA